MSKSTRCPICGYDKAEEENWHDDIMGCWSEVEWTIYCPKCKFSEHWAYGSYCEFNKPKKWRYRLKFKKYVRRELKGDKKRRH